MPDGHALQEGSGFGCIFLWWMAKVGAVGSEKRGIIGKTAGNAGGISCFASLDHGSGGHQTLQCYIFPERGAGCLLKDTADLRSAAIKRIGNGLQRNVVKKMLIDIRHQLALEALCRHMVHSGLLILPVQRGQKQEQTGNQI